nr:CotO family spore coat protein [Anoxybacillus flavithermus]
MQQTFRTKKEKTSYPPPSFANFRDMDTIERIEFLATLPNELRPVTCELKTKNKTYEGVIQTCDKKKVVLTLSDEEKTVTIPLEHIVSVSLIGKS